MSVYETQIRPYVYYDERYPSHWINKIVAKQIADSLEKNEFEIINADETKNIMQEALKNVKEEIVIIFSQDVVPEILTDNPSSPTANSLLRRFLNSGHSIVWMGDIPLLHIGFSNGEKRTLTNTIAQQVLGLDPNVSHVNVPVRHTQFGYMLQLPTWIGTRPHKGTAPNIRGIGFIPLSISTHGVHAFIITYYRSPTGHYALSGFIRLYDMMLDRPEKLRGDIIKGIINIVYRNPLSFIQKRVHYLKEDLDTKFNVLKSELDNLGKILDKILELAKGTQKAQDH